MATHFSILAWKIPWAVEPGRLQSMGLQRVGHDWATEHRFLTPGCSTSQTDCKCPVSRPLSAGTHSEGGSHSLCRTQACEWRQASDKGPCPRAHTQEGGSHQPLQDSGLWVGTSLRQGPLSAGTHSGGGAHTASAGLRPVNGDKPQTRALLFRALNTYSAQDHYLVVLEVKGAEIWDHFWSLSGESSGQSSLILKIWGPPRPCGCQHTRWGFRHFAVLPSLSGLPGSFSLWPHPLDLRLSINSDLCFLPWPWFTLFLWVIYFWPPGLKIFTSAQHSPWDRVFSRIWGHTGTTWAWHCE